MSKFNTLFEEIITSLNNNNNNVQSDEKIYQYDTECTACGQQFCLDEAQYDDDLDSYICPNCGFDHLVDIEIE